MAGCAEGGAPEGDKGAVVGGVEEGKGVQVGGLADGVEDAVFVRALGWVEEGEGAGGGGSWGVKREGEAQGAREEGWA